MCLSLESVWRPPELTVGHWHHFTIRGKWGFKMEISLIAFYQLNPQHTPGATSGAYHGADSSLIWLTFRATSWENWGTWLWPDSIRSNFNLIIDGFCQVDLGKCHFTVQVERPNVFRLAFPITDFVFSTFTTLISSVLRSTWPKLLRLTHTDIR